MSEMLTLRGGPADGHVLSPGPGARWVESWHECPSYDSHDHPFRGIGCPARYDAHTGEFVGWPRHTPLLEHERAVRRNRMEREKGTASALGAAINALDPNWRGPLRCLAQRDRERERYESQRCEHCGSHPDE